MGMNWGKKLEQLLEERGISKAEFASKTGLSESYISRACKGDYQDLSRRNFERIALELDMTLSKLSQELDGKGQTLPGDTSGRIVEQLKISIRRLEKKLKPGTN